MAPSRSLTPGFARADLHVHTTFSDGTATPEDVLNHFAVHSDCSVIAITDHDTLDGARAAERHVESHPDLYGHLELIVGEEVSTRDGHVLGLFLEDWVPPGLSAGETVERIHDQGGIAIAAHPYTQCLRWAGLHGVGDLIHELPFDAIETRNSNFTEVFSNERAAREAVGRAQTGSSDAHFLDVVGRCYTDFPGSSAAALRKAISDRTTVPGGRCYGALALSKFAWGRLRAKGPFIPSRRQFRLQPGNGLEISVLRESSLGAAALALHGRLDGETISEVKRTVTLLAEARIGVVLDLSAVTSMNAAGVTAIVAGMRRARDYGVGFCLVSVSSAASRALAGAGLGQAIPRARSVARGRELVKRRAPPLDLPGEDGAGEPTTKRSRSGQGDENPAAYVRSTR